MSSFAAYAFAAEPTWIAILYADRMSSFKYESTQIYKGAIIKCLLQQHE